MKNLQEKLKNSQEFWFAVVGGLNTILDFVILFSLTAFNVPIIIANIFSTGITFANSFSLNKKITFKSITLFGLWAIQNFIIFILSPIFENIFKNNKIALLISKLIATIFSLIWNFILYKKVVFKK